MPKKLKNKTDYATECLCLMNITPETEDYRIHFEELMKNTLEQLIIIRGQLKNTPRQQQNVEEIHPSIMDRMCGGLKNYTE